MEDNELLQAIHEGIENQVKENYIIKVFGVGGGGCNAVNYMYQQNINAVSFLVANTDSMALAQMKVPHKLQLGEGLGAGGRPEVAAECAHQSEARIREALADGTRMVFITAGMGGGTGTGASPVIAEIARSMGILTVGIVTIPFSFEGKRTIRKAINGVAELAKHTDALLVISNDRLRLLFKELDLPNAFQKADEVLCNAAKSIAEIITVPGYINTDFRDVYNTLKDGNMTIMNIGRATGDKRITNAIQNALTSPLVRTTNVQGASRILLNFYCSHDHAILMEELDEINEFCDSIGDQPDIKWGISYDDSLNEDVKVTIIATGYSITDIPEVKTATEEEQQVIEQSQPEPKKITVEEAMQQYYNDEQPKPTPQIEVIPLENEPVVIQLMDEPQQPTILPPVDNEPAIINLDELNDDQQQELFDIPAWKRRRR